MLKKAVNEARVVAKFIYNTLKNQTANDDPTQKVFSSLNPTPLVFEGVVPVGIPLLTPAAVYVNVNDDDYRGAYGQKLFVSFIYEIKGVIEGYRADSLANLASAIDYTFDWPNQIDPSAGRGKCQEVFTDPDDSTVSITVMTCLRQKPISYNTFSREEGKNYC